MYPKDILFALLCLKKPVLEGTQNPLQKNMPGEGQTPFETKPSIWVTVVVSRYFASTYLNFWIAIVRYSESADGDTSFASRTNYPERENVKLGSDC